MIYIYYCCWFCTRGSGAPYSSSLILGTSSQLVLQHCGTVIHFSLKADLDFILGLDHGGPPLRRLPAPNLSLTQAGAGQITVAAPPPHGQTHRLTQADQHLVDLMPAILRQPSLQRQSGLLGILGLMPAPQVRDAVHVHVDADALVDAPRCRQAEIPHLGPHAGKGHEAFNRVRDVGVVLLLENGRRLLDILRLVVVEADLPDQMVEVCGIAVDHVLDREHRLVVLDRPPCRKVSLDALLTAASQERVPCAVAASPPR